MILTTLLVLPTFLFNLLPILFLLLLLLILFLLLISILIHPQNRVSQYHKSDYTDIILQHLHFFQTLLSSDITTYNNEVIIVISSVRLNFTLVDTGKSIIDGVSYIYAVNWEDIDQLKLINNLDICTTNIDNVKSWQKIIADGFENKLLTPVIWNNIQKINYGRYLDNSNYDQLKTKYVKQKLV